MIRILEESGEIVARVLESAMESPLNLIIDKASENKVVFKFHFLVRAKKTNAILVEYGGQLRYEASGSILLTDQERSSSHATNDDGDRCVN